MLPNIPLFSDLEEAELMTLSSKAVTRHYPRNPWPSSMTSIPDNLSIVMGCYMPV